MPDEPSRARRLATVAIAAALTVGVPVAAVSRIHTIRRDTPLTIIAIFLYEIILAVGSFVLAVSSDLRTRWARRVADSVDSWLRRKTSPFTRKYLRYVQTFTKYMDTIGLPATGSHTPEMTDVLVTLSLSSKSLRGMSSNPVRHHVDPDTNSSENIWYWLSEAQREYAILAIIGPPGSGKTTLLRHVAFTLAKGGRRSRLRGAPNKIPIIINLREHRFSSSANSLSLSDLLRRSLVALDRPEPPSWIEANLRHGKFAILLDGLDEIADQSARVALTEWLLHQSSAQDGNLFVLTSRPFGYLENPIGRAKVVEVQALAERQISSFVNQWYRAISIREYRGDNDSSRLAAKTRAANLLTRLDQTPTLFELTANPLLLTMLVNVHHSDPGALPGSRAELYGDICDVFLAKRDQARGVRVDLTGPQKRAGLRALAYEMASRGITEVKVDDATSWIRPALNKMPRDIEPLEFLQKIEDSAGLLVEKERGIYSFAHLTFQEYLTAEYIRESRKLNEIVNRVTFPWWRETVRLYSAISDATPIVEACLEHGADSDLIVLAAQCADETNEIDKDTLRAVDECINPPSARDDVTARHTAARVRLQLRTSKDIALTKSSFIGGMHVSWLEYQYFIDSLANVECLVPDHWSDSIYPTGTDNEPTAGIRYTDAAKFCEWLNSELQSTLRIRLPRTNEIDKALELSGAKSNLKSLSGTESELNGLAYWTATQSPRSRDGRFWPLLRDPREGARRDAYPWPAHISRQELDRQIETDLGWLQSTIVERYSILTANSAPFQDFPVILSSKTAPLSELLNRCWEESSACDVGQVQTDIRLAETLVRQYVTTDGLVGDARLVQDRLVMLATQLCEISTSALDRKLYSSRRDEQMAQLREMGKRTALEAAVVCMILHAAHGGNVPLPPLEKIIRPSRRVPNPSRQPTVAMNILAHAFMGTYIDFVSLSARISGQVIAVESLIYVREAQDVGRSEIRDPIRKEYEASIPFRMPLVKRLLDLVCSATVLIFLSPLLAVLAFAIRLSDGGPALFTQVRVGKDGRAFRVYKFRTMVVDAERRKAELLALNSSDGVLFKMRQDPRVTALGAHIRRWSIDEFPQLINVLRGDMSLVGPRPVLPDEASKYSDDVRRRLVVKPGMTGLWQVNGRSDISWDESVRLDLRYLENWSLALDLQILWKTILVFLSGSGRY